MTNCSRPAIAGLSPPSPHPLPSCVKSPPLTNSVGLSAALVVDHWSPRGLKPGHHALLSRSWQGRRKGLLVGLRIPHISSSPAGPGLRHQVLRQWSELQVLWDPCCVRQQSVPPLGQQRPEM